MISDKNSKNLVTFADNKEPIENDRNIKKTISVKNSIRIHVLTTLAVLFLPTIGFAQSQDTISTESAFRFELITPGFSYEFPAGSQSTIRVKASAYSLARSIVVFSESRSGLGWHFFPLVDLQYRLYTNLPKRSVNGKAIAENSGNYIALKTIIIFPEEFDQGSDIGNSTWVGPVYGLQRKFSSRLSVDLAAGLGYQIQSRDPDRLFPIATINMAYTIKSKR